MPAADEVGRLQRADDAEARTFRSFCELGHYGGRTQPTGTRQGIYCVTPGGKFLASWNSRNLEHVKRQMALALERWDALDDEERYADAPPAEGRRFEDLYPEDGLVLVAYSRDLDREESAPRPADWRRDAWNIDHAWFSREEAAALAAGALPEAAARRLVRIHGRDNVRGQTSPYPESAIEAARLEARELERSGDRVVLALDGAGSVSESGRWRINDRWDEAAEHSRSFTGAMAGRAVWDGERFVEFELVWAGMRTGATQYNGRADDPGPAPQAVVLRLAAPTDRVAPSCHWLYGWR